jgi:hypothetical protein
VGVAGTMCVPYGPGWVELCNRELYLYGRLAGWGWWNIKMRAEPGWAALLLQFVNVSVGSK